MAVVQKFAENAAAVLTPSHTRTIAASAAHATGDTEQWDFEQSESAGLIVVFDATVHAVSAAIVVTIQGVDPVSGKTWDILSSASITGVSTTVLKVHPGITTAANAAVADAVPCRIRIKVVPGNANSATYSIGATLTA
jgi:hypothetical protein